MPYCAFCCHGLHANPRTSTCPLAAGVDAEMRMRLKTLYFFANRPTIGALIALGSDIGAAMKSPAEVSSCPQG